MLVQAGNRHGCCFRLIPEIGWSRRGQRHVVSAALSLRAEPGRNQSTLRCCEGSERVLLCGSERKSSVDEKLKRP